MLTSEVKTVPARMRQPACHPGYNAADHPAVVAGSGSQPVAIPAVDPVFTRQTQHRGFGLELAQFAGARRSSPMNDLVARVRERPCKCPPAPVCRIRPAGVWSCPPAAVRTVRQGSRPDHACVVCDHRIIVRTLTQYHGPVRGFGGGIIADRPSQRFGARARPAMQMRQFSEPPMNRCRWLSIRPRQDGGPFCVDDPAVPVRPRAAISSIVQRPNAVLAQRDGFALGWVACPSSERARWL